MSIEGAIKAGEEAVKNMALEKEAKRVEALSPEDKKADEAKKAEAKQAEADKAILEAKDETLDDAGKQKKTILAQAIEKKRLEDETRILGGKDEELSEKDLELKADILKKKKAQKESEREANIQARIDEIDGKFKASEAKRLEAEKRLADLEAKQSGKDPKKVEVEIERLENARIEKYEQEDASLPKEKRREMSNDDLQEWLVEDMVAANRWLAKQEVRRDRERSADESKLSGSGDEMKSKADVVIQKQRESNERVFKKHPELNINKRIADLKAEGKTREEISGIIQADPKCKLALEIIKENEDKYLLSENGPELVADEIEKRLKTQKVEKKEFKDEEDFDAAVEREIKRRQEIDEGINSTRGKTPETKLTDLEKGQWAIFKKSFPNKTLADFRISQERRKKHANA